MSEQDIQGYGYGDVTSIMSVDAVQREAERIAEDAPSIGALDALVKGPNFLTIDNLRSGYGAMEILHDFSLRVGKGQSLCLIGPNGAGKSTVLHSIFGFATVMDGSIKVDGKEVSKLSSNDKLKDAGIAYILQDNSVFPDMTVEENLWMGGFLKPKPAQAHAAAEKIFAKYDRLAERRHQPARVLSGGERRLLEISRALVMEPDVLLVDEPSIGLGATLHRHGVRNPRRPAAQRRQDHRHGRAERQEGIELRRYRLRAGVGPTRQGRPGHGAAGRPGRGEAVFGGLGRG